MAVYRQKYEDWFNYLSEAERRAETARMNACKSTRAKHNAHMRQLAEASPMKQEFPYQIQHSVQLSPSADDHQGPIDLDDSPLMGGPEAHHHHLNNHHHQVEHKILPIPTQVTPVGPPISLANLTPVMMPQGVAPPPGTMIPINIPTQQPISIQAIPIHGGQGHQMQQQQVPPPPALHILPAMPAVKDRAALRADILRREPIEPARSPRQLFILDWLVNNKKKTPEDARKAWRGLERKDKKKWLERLEPQRQKYIEDYTVFVRGLDKEELEMYTELKQKRDEEEEAKRQNDSSSDSESDEDSSGSGDDEDDDDEDDGEDGDSGSDSESD